MADGLVERCGGQQQLLREVNREGRSGSCCWGSECCLLECLAPEPMSVRPLMGNDAHALLSLGASLGQRRNAQRHSCFFLMLMLAKYINRVVF